MSRAAFMKAERRRRHWRPVSRPQRFTLTRLSTQAGVELPIVRSSRQATDAIRRLKRYLAQPMLDGWREASVA